MAADNKRMTFEEQRAQRQKAAGKPTSASMEAKKPPILPIAIAVIAMIVLIGTLRVCSAAMTIDVTVNGVPCTLHGAKTIQTAIKESGLPINPGDLISLRGTVLERSAGDAVDAEINGVPTTDLAAPLHNGDTVTIADGKDIVEDYDTSEEETEHSARISGAGAIHAITPGQNGQMEVRTGKISGDVVRRLINEPSEAICVKSNPEVGEDKVIALTFEEGPSPEYTTEILDILQENEAHATFFCVGQEIEKYNDELVQRELDEGHQVGTGTYSFARQSDADKIKNIETEELRSQMQRGIDALIAAVGEGNFSLVSRLPGGKVDEKIIQSIDDFVEANIGWNVDTGDWMEDDSDSEEIYNVLMSLESGDIVRLHDGGGDHSATITALRRALPELREQGYRFVTIADLMEYPPQ